MADSRIDQLTEDTAPTLTDLVYVEHDPGGTPANRKVQIGNLPFVRATRYQTVANAAARLALAPTDGDIVTELDTDRMYKYNGTAWVWIGGGTNPTAARGYATVATTLTAGGFKKIALGGETYDYGNNFAGGTYTAPEVGLYDARGRDDVGIPTSGDRLFVSIYVNGAERSRGIDVTAGNTNPLSSSVADSIELAADDTVELWGFCSAARVTETGTTLAYLTVRRI